MESYKDDKRLAKLAEECFKDPPISQGMLDSQLSESDVRKALHNNASTIWETVTSELQELEKLEQRIIQFEKDYEGYLSEPKVRYNKAYGLKLIPLFFILLVMLVFFPVMVWLSNYLLGESDIFGWDFSRLRTWLVVFFMSSTLILGYRVFIYIVYLIIKQWNGRYLLRRTEQGGYLDYVSWQARYIDLARLTDENLREKGIVEMIRTMINERITPSYALSLAHIEGKGLAEVIDLNQTIDSQAKKKLDFLLNNMPGGSIGLAGPRGAGKSTLIQTFCGPGRTVSQLNDKKVLATMVSAPVKYEPRDFILYLFSAVCTSVLKETHSLPDDLYEEEMNNSREQPFRSSRLWLWSYLPVLSMFLGFILMLCSFVLYDWHLEYNTARGQRKTYGMLDSLAGKNKGIDSVQSRVATVKSFIDTSRNKLDSTSYLARAQRDTTLSFFTFYAYRVSKSADTPVLILNIALLLLVIGALMLVFGNRERNAFVVLFTVFARIFFRTNPTRRRKHELYGDEMSATALLALRWLKKLKFQQSYTTGWSGSLKLPIALEGSLSQAMTLAEKQLSNPEIIAAFTDFLVKCTAEYQVIIGIDELDKITLEEDAKLFLNEIKSIFGIQRVFYLISVSENAMNNFERRGMPFRDVFDSSFDSIVYVDYLDLNATHLLLQRRIVGKPMPFFSLAFCLAGGLPRDVIRYFRQILELAVSDRQLVRIAQKLVVGEVEAKIRATLQVLRKLRRVSGAEEVIVVLYGIKPPASRAAEFEVAASVLRKQLNCLGQIVEPAEASEEHRALMALVSESCSYLAYASTLMTLFSITTETRLKLMEADGHWQELGHVRQLLAVDHALALELVISLRKKTGLKALSEWE